MPEHPLRRILSKILRGPKKIHDVELVYVHRGAAEDQLSIKVSTISRVGKGWFMLEDGETQIPFHRVLYVKDSVTGSFLWQRRQRESHSSPRL
jgi:uncharacterized protein (UPF0248 family)